MTQPPIAPATAARLLGALLVSPERELSAFRAAMLGPSSTVPVEHLAAMRAALTQLAEALGRSDEDAWRLVLEARDLLARLPPPPKAPEPPPAPAAPPARKNDPEPASAPEPLPSPPVPAAVPAPPAQVPSGAGVASPWPPSSSGPRPSSEPSPWSGAPAPVPGPSPWTSTPMPPPPPAAVAPPAEVAPSSRGTQAHVVSATDPRQGRPHALPETVEDLADHLPEASVMPFRRGAAVPPPVDHEAAHPNLGATSRMRPPLPQALPFERPEPRSSQPSSPAAAPPSSPGSAAGAPSSEPNAPALSLEQYAAFSARSAEHPEQAAEVQRDYNLSDPLQREILDVHYRRRFQQSPELRAQFDELCERYRQWYRYRR